MWTFNCAKVYVGAYYADTNEFCHKVDCKYEVLNGKVTAKKLKPIKVRPQEEEIGLLTLQTYALYPVTDAAIIAIYNSYGKHLVKLVKQQQGLRSTNFNARL